MARQNFVGLVVSQGKMAKTVKVRVQSKGYDVKVNKEVLKRKDYLVHDEGELCKEGDIVRIEAIPKISPRKYFAVAEIKVNKGQQFALYEQLAKEKVAQEEKAKILDFLLKRNELESIITKIDDLKLLDQHTSQYRANPDANREQLLLEINRIKEKYNIPQWPAKEPVLDLEVNTDADRAVLDESKPDLASKLEEEQEAIRSLRLTHISTILEVLMNPEYTTQRDTILKAMNKDPATLKRHTLKNILRRYILEPTNKCPIALKDVSFN